MNNAGRRLSREAQAAAQAFIFDQGRALEQAKYAFYFGDGDAGPVIEALAAFQNPDGGFGYALEPDLRLEGSSVIATTVGLQTLREFRVSGDHPLVKGALGYLLATYDSAQRVWPIIPSNIDDAPHAPWWVYSEDLAERWGGFLVNPRAEIVGYLHDYADLVPVDLTEQLTAAVIAYLDVHADQVGMFDLLCYIRLVETESLPAETRAQLVEALTPLVDALVVKDSAKWDSYVLTPLEVVEHPDAPFAELLAAPVAANLDFEVDRQGPDGAWGPTWSWGELHPEAWAQAKQEWSGIITLRKLRALERFGRLA